MLNHVLFVHGIFSCMSKLIYITNTSLDGYVEDAAGAFDWVNPDQVFVFITDFVFQER
jgi:hypothetical protein